MLSSPSIRLPLFQIDASFLPSAPLQPFPTKQKERRRRSTQEKNHNKILKTPCFSSRSPLISTQKQNPSNFRCFLQNPDAESSQSSWIKILQDPRILASLLKSCSTLKEVKRIHAITVKLLDSSITFVDNNLISAYVRFFELVDARKLFDRMPDRNVVSWTAILNGYLKMGIDEEALRLFAELIETSIRANSLTFVCLLKLCTKRLDFELGQQIHASIMKGNWSNLIVDSALVNFYGQCGDLSGASRLFDRMPKWDVICWTAMITATAQQGHGDKVFSMFSQMQYTGFKPNEFTVCSVLKACGEEKALRSGKQLHGAIVKGKFKQDVFIGSSLVGMYVKCGEVLDARAVFDSMPKRNTVTWTSMIAGYAQNDLGEQAISLFRRMKKRRIFANDLTVVSILSACGSTESFRVGKEVHGQILKNFTQSNIHIGSTLIWFYCKCGEYAYAARILEAMPVRDVISWTAIISGYTSLGHGLEALGFLNNMLWEGVDPNPYTYSSALKACAKLEALRKGKWIHASANKTSAISNVFVGSALINMYMKCGCITDAFRVFDTMPERNLVSWKAMIIGYARNGRCREALKLMYRMQSEGFNVDDFVLTTVLSACGDVQWELDCSSASSVQSG